MLNRNKASTASLVSAALIILVALILPAKAEERRIALVIGNAAYSNVTPLDNPLNDAELMASSLEAVGFEVILVTEATQLEMVQSIASFGSKLRDAGEDATGLFYYAGHGVQSFGSNFLLPVDIALNDAADLSLVGVPAQAVLWQMFSAKNRTNIVILDACRNNPFTTIADLNDNGLAEMKAPKGTFLSYSTAPGEIAIDGVGSNSPFTEALAQRMSEPGLPVEALFKKVRVDVLSKTGGLQTPWDTSSLTTDFQFVAAEAPPAQLLQMRQLWDSVRLSRDPVQILLFLRANPDSVFTKDARALLQELMLEELQAEAQKPAPDVETAKQPEPAVQPEPVSPGQTERDLIEEARKTGSAEAYENYLSAYPEGAFAELARLELQSIETNAQRTDPISDPQPVVTQEPQQPEPDQETRITFNAPLGIGDAEIATRSIAQLIQGSPRFPPIEGLPEDAWKNKSCASCHQWEQDNLCEQAQTYLKENSEAADKAHPYGGGFKSALRDWARSGCE
ncbi:Caspase domain protein [Labrenzia sp. THAF82]|uniref:caspase family protein n=1 Tax=Labrenzia sp. THAF82 TaxID=2587861 RepID=UPI0012A92F00|nr:caspase family protein [Labrenzia sp. THAF82]QFT33590.1 Caspase domain protein [Labrenzia sp. THAF82]